MTVQNALEEMKERAFAPAFQKYLFDTYKVLAQTDFSEEEKDYTAAEDYFTTTLEQSENEILSQIKTNYEAKLRYASQYAFNAGLYSGFVQHFSNQNLVVDGFEKHLMQDLFEMPGMQRHTLFLKMHDENKKLIEQLEIDGDKERREHLTSIECAWEQRVHWAACHSFYCGYEAAAEFAAQTSGELDDLLSQLGGKPGAVQTLEKLEQAEKTAADKLAALLEQLRGAPQDDPALSAAVVKAANDAESKRRQADAVNKLVDAGLAQNQAEAGALIARAVSAAAERAEEVQTILGAWSDAPGDMRKTDANAALLERVRDSKTLQDISRYLGRFREIFAQGKRNGYAYGRGEKYALELGNDLSRALTSELAMLAVPETLPLFLRKYQHRQIKQYRRREPVYKGAGDIICCLDESGSTAGDLAAWGKAVAMTLLEIAQSEGRKFALVHFSGPGRFQTDVFLPRQSSLEEKLHAAETFLGGGTDFQTPLAEAERLMREGGFENADIAFITDGECSLPETCVEMLQKAQSELRFTVTGILLDEGNAGMDFSLKPFCQNIYRTSELTGDQMVEEIVLDCV